MFQFKSVCEKIYNLANSPPSQATSHCPSHWPQDNIRKFEDALEKHGVNRKFATVAYKEQEL